MWLILTCTGDQTECSSSPSVAILKDYPSRLNEPPVTRRGQELTSPFFLHLGMRACFYEDTVGNESFVSSALIIIAFPCCWMQVSKAYAIFFWHTSGHKIFLQLSAPKTERTRLTLPDFCEAVSREMM